MRVGNASFEVSADVNAYSPMYLPPDDVFLAATGEEDIIGALGVVGLVAKGDAPTSPRGLSAPSAPVVPGLAPTLDGKGCELAPCGCLA